MPFSVELLNFWTKLKRWEYWPFGVVYFPIFFYWLYLSVKARSFFFFSAANPSIETGGMLGESKFKILEKIATDFKPATLFIEMPREMDAILGQIDASGISFPLIAKPDVGERGWKVEKLHSRAELAMYVKQMRGNFIIQEYVDYELEIGLFYYRFPNQHQGVVSSIVMKEFLTLTGDGKSSILELIMANERARLQYLALEQLYGAIFPDVLPPLQKLTLVHIGNHCRGTKFLNANHLITNELVQVFDRISQAIPGFYFGRYDLRCRSIEDLYKGREINILELNGAGAEPAHIYDPQFPFFKAYGVLFHHWSVLYRISKTNYSAGINYMSFKEGWQTMHKLRTYRRRMNS